MVWFSGGGDQICESWLSGLPRDIDLAQTSEETVERLVELPLLCDGIGLSVVSKVTHHKRPRLIPLFDRALETGIES